MPPKKRTPEQAPEALRPMFTESSTPGRKPWKKKTPVDVVREQTERQRHEVALREEALADAKRQLQKLEQAFKALDED